MAIPGTRPGGLNLLGYPVTEEHEAWTADGARRLVQYFERTLLAYYPEDSSVRLEPLGWQTLVRERALSPTVAQQVR